MNKWKIAFAITFLNLLFVMFYGYYLHIDQAYTIEHQRDAAKWQQEDIDKLIVVFNKTDFSKTQIKKELLALGYHDFSTDTVQLMNIYLIFENDKLKRIKAM